MAAGDFHWERDGKESVLYHHDGEQPNGEPTLALVSVVQFEDDGSFRVDHIKIGPRLLEMDADVIAAKGRDAVEAAILAQARKATSSALTQGMTRQ